jgi:signal recognition particle receptor subunit beta
LAVLDSQNNAVVIRVVYDGAPMAGKTTSVCALGKGLGAGVYSPAELNGRTLYFDWLDYTGGLFEGHRIRCQIVSAPGQTSLAVRRRQLLESADVVVFVGDSTPMGFEADRAYLGSLCSVLRQLDGPPIGIVLQANKRDLPDAVPVKQMRSMLDGMDMKVGVVESVATEGSGIREAFVFAVRLALDRVRELMRTGELKTGKPAVDSAQDLLEEMKRREDGALDLAETTVLSHSRLSDLRGTGVAAGLPAGQSTGAASPTTSPLADQPVANANLDQTNATPPTLASEALEQVVREEMGTPSDSGFQHTLVQRAHRLNAAGQWIKDHHQPIAPNERVASGMVWPPIDGRTILQEIGSSQVQLNSSVAGDWFGVVNDRWRIHTQASAVFSSVDQGRPALIQLARTYAANLRSDTTERCVALAEDGHGRFRLWQIQRLDRN